MKTNPTLFYGIIVEQTGPEVWVVSCFVSRILLSAWFAWCLVFVSGISMGRCHTGYTRSVGESLRTPSEASAIHPTHFSFYCMHECALSACRLVHKWMDEGLNPKWITNKPMDWINVGSCCCNAVLSKIGGVGFACESCPMLGFCTRKKTNFWVFSSSWGVFSVCGFCDSAFQSFKCVCGALTHVCIHKAHFLSSPRLAQLFCLYCTLVW